MTRSIAEASSRAPRSRFSTVWQRLETVPAPLLVFGIALIARVGAAILVQVLFQGAVFGDDANYSRLAADKANHVTAHWGSYEDWLYTSVGAFAVPLTWIYRLLGPVQLAGQLMVAAVGALAAVLTGALAHEAVGRRGQLLAGMLVALLPSQVMFSAVTMKDAFIWACLAGIAVLVAMAGRSELKWLPAYAAGIVVTLVLLRYLRVYTMVAACWAVGLSAWAGASRGRLVRGAFGIATLLFVPYFVGWGFAGWDLRPEPGSIYAYRHGQPDGTASIYEEVAERAAGRPDTPAAPADQRAEPGSPSVNPTIPPTAPRPPGLAEDFGEVHGGLVAVVLAPFPWTRPTSGLAVAARAEIIVWYALLALGAVGAFALRRHLRVALFPIVATGLLALKDALGDSNVGTIYRHRGEFVWAVVLFASVGVVWLRDRRRAEEAVPANVQALDRPAVFADA